MGILISVITITLLVLCYVRMYNRLKRLSVKVQEGSAGIDVALEKRYDMLSEEIEAVKKYLAHEYQIYTEVTSTRAGKKLNESIFQEKKQLSEEAVKAISETITEQQKQMETIRQQLEQQRGQDNSLGAETPGMGGDGLIGHQVSLDRKLGLLASAQQGLTGVNSAINALAEQYPTLYSYASMQHFQQDIFDAEEHLQAARRLYNSNVSLYNQRINTFPYLLLAKLHGMKEAKFYTVEEKKKDCALPGFVDSKNEEKTERNAGYLVVSHSGGGMLRQGTRKGIRRTPANRGMRAHWVVKGLDISEDVCHGMCP